MRIWKGAEREDEEGKITLFVEAAVVDDYVVEIVKQKLKENPEVERVYFGAGGVTKRNTLLRVIADLSDLQVEKVAEIHSRNVFPIDTTKFDKVILTTPVEHLDNIVPKIETTNKLRVFTKHLEVDFSEVQDGLYNNDEEIFNE